MFTLYTTPIALNSVIKAANFAALKHKDQRRRDPSQTPYINYLIGLATIIIEEGKIYDPTVLQAALLKDTVEDTDATLDEIQKEFGYQVCQIVGELTDDKNVPKHERRRLQIANIGTKCKETQLIRLAEKLYNVRDLEKTVPLNWSDQDIDDFCKFSKMLVDKIRGVNINLEKAFDKVYSRRV